MMHRIVVALAAAVCLFELSPGAAAQPPTTSASPAVLHDLTNARELAARFDADHGTLRIVMLLSPT